MNDKAGGIDHNRFPLQRLFRTISQFIFPALPQFACGTEIENAMKETVYAKNLGGSLDHIATAFVIDTT